MLQKATALAVPVLLAVAGLAVVGPTGAAAAAEAAFRCDAGTVYLVRGNGEVDGLDAATGKQAATPLVAGHAGVTTAGELGVGRDGSALVVVDGRIVEHGAGAGSGAAVAGGAPSRLVVGAVDPTSGVFYYGGFSGSRLVLFGFDPRSGSGFGPAARVSLPGRPGKDGDVAFDAAGQLYVVASSKKKAASYVVATSLPTGGSVPVSVTARRLGAVSSKGVVTGAAFASDGYLYVSTATSIRRVNPTNGRAGTAVAVSGAVSGAGAGGGVADLGSCASPSLLRVQAEVPDGRLRAADQVRTTIRGGDVDRLVKGARPSGSTSGSEVGVQDQEPGEVAGPVAVLPGGTFRVAQSGAHGADLDRYVASSACVDRADGDRLVASGAGKNGDDARSGAVTVPAGSSGADVVCTFADAAPKPRLKVTQSVDPTSYAKAGQVLTWTSVVTNFGNTSLRRLEVTDSVAALSDRSCAPVKVGATLPAGVSTTCTATFTVTQAVLDAGLATADVVTASATTAQRQGTIKATASATATSTGTVAPGLSLTVTTSPTSVSLPGQSVAYSFVALNRGNQTLHGVLVTAHFPGLSALVCSPVAQGGTLAPQATTTCRATRTVGVAELAADPLKETAKVEATTETGTRVANSGAASVAVKALPPVVPDETVGAVAGGPVVPLHAARNARPGAAGGPAIDLSRTVFVDPNASTPFDGKQKRTSYAEWTIFPDGSVRVQQLVAESQSVNDEVDYRVYDTAGHSTVGHLFVQIHLGATAGPPVGVTIKQNQPITVDVLSHDHPGQNADGTPSSFDRSTLRLTGVDLGDRYWDLPPTNYGGDEESISVVGVGDYTATTDGRITFVPAAGYYGTPPPVRYSATSRGGSTVSNVLAPTVQRVKPTAGAQATSVAYGQVAVLAVAAGAKAGNPSAPIVPGSVVLTSATATDAGQTLATYRGTWRVQDDGSVRFSPADGFVGKTAPVEYTVADRNGTLATSTLTVTVRPGPKAVPDRGVTPKGSSVLLTPLGNDVAGVEADGSAGSFVTASLAFPNDGQPAGAAVKDGGHTLTVPAEGTWHADSGVVTFAPDSGFAGGATPVSYAATDDLGNVETGRITVAVTSSVPAATDDEAATTFATSVKLAGATNDSAGSSPLAPSSTVFAAGGKKLTVPGEGTWTLAADGSAAFTPGPTYSGTTTPVTYRIVDGAGKTATATLVVTVRPGPAGTPDVISPHGTQVVIPLADNDVPGRNADGTLGTIDVSTVRFAPTGQPKGWVISEDGHLATLPPIDGIQRSVFIDGNNVVTAYAPADFSGVFGPLVYTAQDRVVDAAGFARRHPYTSTMQVTFAGTDVGPTATDDHAVTTNQLPVRLAAQSNDLGGSSGLQYEGMTFPTDQLGGLPAGSKINDDRLVVAGEGTYYIDARDVSVQFIPDAGFATDKPRDTTPVEYQIKDFAGRTARATLTVRVLPGAVARPDTATTPQNVIVNVDVVANDDPGPSLTRVRIPRSMYGGQGFGAPQPKGSTYSSRTQQLTVPGQGVYSINRDGTVAFDPDSQFRGVASPVTIAESFEADRPFLGPFMVNTTSTLQVTVVGTDPVARPDTGSAQVGRPVVIDVLDNDAAGSPIAPLVSSSVRLRLDGLPPGSTLSANNTMLTIPGRAVFLAAGNGEITVVPLGNATGPLPVVRYQVADANGTTKSATLTVTVS